MKTVALALLVLLPLQAMGEGLKYVPAWHMTGKEACYDFAAAKKLVEVDLQLDAYVQKAVVWDRMTADLKAQVQHLNDAVAAEKAVNGLLTQNNSSLVKQLLETTARANKAEANQSPGAGWLVGGGIAVAALGLVGGILLGVKVLR